MSFYYADTTAVIKLLAEETYSPMPSRPLRMRMRMLE